MKVLIACEFSGIVRDAFRARGHDAISCDLLPSERPGPHIQADIHSLDISGQYDLMIAFPPCTFLARSGAWKHHGTPQMVEALEFVMRLMLKDVPRIAIENPRGAISTSIRPPDQVIQPWQFGHGETKTTCLWLTNLPCLVPTNVVNGREERILNMSPSPDRWKNRSRTYQGIAEAMASQWGEAELEDHYRTEHVKIKESK